MIRKMILSVVATMLISALAVVAHDARRRQRTARSSLRHTPFAKAAESGPTTSAGRRKLNR